VRGERPQKQGCRIEEAIDLSCRFNQGQAQFPGVGTQRTTRAARAPCCPDLCRWADPKRLENFSTPTAAQAKSTIRRIRKKIVMAKQHRRARCGGRPQAFASEVDFSQSARQGQILIERATQLRLPADSGTGSTGPCEGVLGWAHPDSRRLERSIMRLAGLATMLRTLHPSSDLAARFFRRGSGLIDHVDFA